MKITKYMLNNWQEMFNALNQKYAKYDNKLMQYIFDDVNEDRIKRMETKLDKIDAEMDGMQNALRIFGYTVELENGQYIVVRLNDYEEGDKENAN